MNERMDAGFPQVSIGFVLIIIGGWLISNGLKTGPIGMFSLVVDYLLQSAFSLYMQAAIPKTKQIGDKSGKANYSSCL